MEAPSDALPNSMLQEVQTIHRWDGLKLVAGASGNWSGEEATGVGVAGVRNRADHRVRKEWGEKVDPAFGQWAEGDIHDRIVESDEIFKVNGSEGNQERLREVAVTVVPIAHGEVKSSTVLGGSG